MIDLPIKKVSDEVFIATDSIVRIDRRAIDYIKNNALTNQRGRSRICIHKSKDDLLHEMLIAIRSDSYIRPHKHHNKVESFHLIEGRADILILNEIGEIIDIIKLGPQDNFYYRLESPFYHTLIIHTPILVIHEITNGPFNPEDSDMAPFAPLENDPSSINFMNALKLKALKYSSI